MHKMQKVIQFLTIILLTRLCAVECFVELDALTKKATYLDAKVGSYAVLNCPLEFPHDIEIPYILHWNKDVSKK